mmetsp:Transcript_53631/g.152840  ORF Transcript_53631/g.152840 Transcript_53631/m.152840 type:complete len:252 (+) Transcript_53631:1489-2244(+)
MEVGPCRRGHGRVVEVLADVAGVLAGPALLVLVAGAGIWVRVWLGRHGLAAITAQAAHARGTPPLQQGPQALEVGPQHLHLPGLVALLEQQHRHIDVPRLALQPPHASDKHLGRDLLGVVAVLALRDVLLALAHKVEKRVCVLLEAVHVQLHRRQPGADLLVTNDGIELLAVEAAAAIPVGRREQLPNLPDVGLHIPRLLVQHDGVVRGGHVEGHLQEDAHYHLAHGKCDDELVSDDEEEVPLTHVLREAP